MTAGNELRARAERFREAQPVPPRPEAPDPGLLLAEMHRQDGTTLRVSLHTFEGHPFLRIAPWCQGEGGALWPVKGKGCTVKVREIAVLAEGIAAAMDAVDAMPRPAPRVRR